LLKVLLSVFNGKFDVRFLKIAIKALSDAKKISPLVRKVLEVPTSLEINFSIVEVGLHCSFHLKRLADITACWVKYPTLQRTDETLQAA